MGVFQVQLIGLAVHQQSRRINWESRMNLRFLFTPLGWVVILLFKTDKVLWEENLDILEHF